MSSIKCRLGIHNWSEYSVAVNTYMGLTQFRKCERCNKIGWRGFYGNQAKSSDVNKSLGFDAKASNNER